MNFDRIVNRLKPRPEQALLKLPRAGGVFRFAGFDIEYTHPISLYYELIDIFRERIYHFDAETERPYIIDAGSSIGATILYFKSIYPQARILGFEPDPQVFAVLERNIANNRLNDIDLMNCGLAKQPGSIQFFADGSDGGSMFGGHRADDKAVINVPVERLGDHMTQEVRLLKLSIEGMEGEVFEEISNTLDLVQEIIFEYHCFHCLPQTLGRILTILDEAGFRYQVGGLPRAGMSFPAELPRDYKLFNIVHAKRIG